MTTIEEKVLFTPANFPDLKNDRLLKVIKGEPTDVSPVWIMRQAGRYLPAFREMRQYHNFFEVVQTPELACEVTLQPIRQFQLDAAIIFSDILVIPQAFGMEVQMLPDKGPVFPNPIVTPADAANLKPPESLEERLSYVYKAITLTRHRLEGKVPLIGFAGSPWTLASYMIEGQSSKQFAKSRRWFYAHPFEMLGLMEKLANLITEHLVLQAKAGAQMLQIFESHLGYLNRRLFLDFEWPLVKKIGQEVKERLAKEGLDVPLAIFLKDGGYALKDVGSEPDIFPVVGIDWTIEASVARAQVDKRVTLMGNLDPVALGGDNDYVDVLVEQMCKEFGKERWIANLGHGIYPDAKVECVTTFVNAVHKYSGKKIVKL